MPDEKKRLTRAETVRRLEAGLKAAKAEKAEFDRSRAVVADVLLKVKVLVREARAAWKDERDADAEKCILESRRLLDSLTEKGGDS